MEMVFQEEGHTALMSAQAMLDSNQMKGLFLVAWSERDVVTCAFGMDLMTGIRVLGTVDLLKHNLESEMKERIKNRFGDNG